MPLDLIDEPIIVLGICMQDFQRHSNDIQHTDEKMFQFVETHSGDCCHEGSTIHKGQSCKRQIALRAS